MFKVQKKMCSTCIYRKDSPLDLQKLEQQVQNATGGYDGYRICHHSNKACCAGFWQQHKNDFPAGRLAQICNKVQFVNEDTMKALK